MARPADLETGFGVPHPDGAYVNPVVLSTRVVGTYCAGTDMPATQWGYEGEGPLTNLHGGRFRRFAAHPSQFIDDPARPAPSDDAPPADTAETADPSPAP